jgi:hypothetical protein
MKKQKKTQIWKKYEKPEKGRETRLRMGAPESSTLPTFCTTTIVRKNAGNPVVHARTQGFNITNILY